MGIVVSMLLIAVGAVMRFAVTVEGDGFNVGTTGMILMVVGVIGALLSIGFWASWGGFGRTGRTGTGTVAGGRSTVVHTTAAPTVVAERTVVEERDIL